MAENPQIDDRVFFMNLPDQEGDKADHGNDRQGDDLGRSKPVEILALVEHQLQGSHPDNEQDEANPVDRVFRQGIGVTLQEIPANESAADGNRCIEEEHPVPTVFIAEIAAQDRAENRRDGRCHRPDGDGHRRFFARENTQQQGLRQRHQRPGGKALKNTCHDQQAQRGGNTAQGRKQRKQQQ